MYRRDYPCKGCTDRHVGCHSVCDRYNETKRIAAEEKKKAVQDATNARAIGDLEFNRIRSLLRGRKH